MASMSSPDRRTARSTTSRSADTKRLLEIDPDRGESRRAELIIKNTYRTLMTRGLKGCYVYFTDQATSCFVRDRIVSDRSGRIAGRGSRAAIYLRIASTVIPKRNDS